MITQERLKELLSYDPDTGVFTWKVSRGNCKSCDKAGSIAAGSGGKSYLQIMVDGKRYLAHRLAWIHRHGHFPPHEIDHINGDGVDNRLCNLRSVTGSENRKNRRLQSNNISGTCGVYWHKASGKWQAQIKVDSKYLHLGSFEDINDAVKARKEADIKYGFHENHGSNRPL